MQNFQKLKTKVENAVKFQHQNDKINIKTRSIHINELYIKIQNELKKFQEQK